MIHPTVSTRWLLQANRGLVTNGALLLVLSLAGCPSDDDAPQCGNGVLEASEECDDGNTDPGDGCAGSCQVENGWACGGEPSLCEEICGDGVMVGGEACDDGNGDTTDGCPDGVGGTCQPARCGDGLTWAAVETCDDGNGDNTDACPDDQTQGGTCQPARCGDGHLWAGVETCDAGDASPNDGCGADCQIEAGWSCSGLPSVCTPICGDGVIVGDEECDSANFNGLACTDYPPSVYGELLCSAACLIDIGGCYNGDTCDTAVSVSDSTAFSHSTATATDDYNGNGCGEIAADTTGPDRAYRVELDAGEYVVAWLRPVNWNGNLYLTTDCNSISPATCPEGWWRNDADGGNETLHFATTTAITVFVVVDGGGAGEYELELTIGSWNLPQLSGDVIVSEVLRNPEGAGESTGEWFELYNPGSSGLNLEGMAVHGEPVDGDLPFVIDRPLIIGPGAHLVLAPTADWTQNGDVNSVAWVYDRTVFGPLANSPVSDRIRLEYNGATLDEFAWDATWPDESNTDGDGLSMELCVDPTNAMTNDTPANWYEATTHWSSTNIDFGTPGEPNANGQNCL